MREDAERTDPADSPGYPLGVIGAAIGHTFLMTIMTYLLCVTGLTLGLWIGSGSWDFSLLFDGESFAWVLLLPVFLLLAILVGYVSAFAACVLIFVLWISAVYSETVKARAILLGLIFATAFACALYIGLTA